MDVAFTENYPDGSSQNVFVFLVGDSRRLISANLVSGWLGDILYIWDILASYIEDDPLGCRDYEAGFALKKGEMAVLTWKGGEKPLKELGMFLLVNVSYGANNENDIPKKRFTKGDAITLSAPGQYAFLAECGNGWIDLTEYVDIQITQIE